MRIKKKRTIFIVIFIVLFVVLASWALTKKLTGVDWFANISQKISSTFQSPSQSNSTTANIIPLSYTVNSPSLTTPKPIASFTLKSNKAITTDSTRVSLYLTKTDVEGVLWYVAEVSNLGLGTSSVNFNVKDSDNNTKSVNVVITRQSGIYGTSDIKDWDGSVYTADGDSLLAQVDKGHKLAMDYSPSDMVDISKDLLLYTNTSNQLLIRKEAGDELVLMAKDIQRSTGKNLVIQSAYRSYNDQFSIYALSLRDNGQDATDQSIARPGFSEHQLGTAVDFVDQESGLTLTNDFDNSTIGKWLAANAYKYGFIMSYPAGKEDVTGYEHEAWHWRYIGIDNATKVMNSGLTLKEYLDQLAKSN